MEANYEKLIKSNRDFMKSDFAESDYVSDQQKKVAQPPLTKAAIGSEIISLPKDFSGVMLETNYYTLLEQRKSERVYKDEALTISQLSFLLWTTQGVKEIRGNNYAALRFVPSAGARHPFETYLAVLNVDGLKKGIYHYLPLEHSIELIEACDNLEKLLSDSLCQQDWALKAAATFFYSVVPYRGEWRYSTDAHRVMLLDAGHVVQNLYLSSKAVGCGTCAIAAYDQILADRLLKLDGENEFVIYAAPVGVV
ncbi:MAG: nitroreductase family protein [Eubacterium sp.]|jgi:SagB-type dehydrogenase family enzyme|nr:nitroreductase family protein [Eubacterium sp.]